MISPLTFCLAFAIGMFLTPFCRDVCVRMGFLDLPDGRRKLHSCPVPRFGGVPLVIAFLVSVGSSVLVSRAGALDGPLALAAKLLPGLIVVFALGVWDDARGVRPYLKLGVEIVAGAAVYLAGIQITHLGAFTLPAPLGFTLTVTWLVLCANAFNLIDGSDGVAAGAGVCAVLPVILHGYSRNNFDVGVLMMCLAGALLAFLVFNFNPATIYLGDAGSLSVGFLIGCGWILSARTATDGFGMISAAIALSFPLLDLSLAIARRYLRGVPIFHPDRGHIHHRLLDRGFTPRQVAYVVWAVCAVAALLSAVSGLRHPAMPLIGSIATAAAVVCGIRLLRYPEFTTVARVVFGGLRSHISKRLAISHFIEELATGQSPLECVGIIRLHAAQFGFSEVHWNSEADYVRRPDADAPACSVELRLSGGGRVLLNRNPFGDVSASFSMAFVDAIAEHLPPTLAKSAHQASPWSISGPLRATDANV